MEMTSQKVERLFRGQHVFKLWAFSMLFTKLKNEYAADPTQTKLEYCVNEINAFISKYQNVMAPDLAIIQHV